MMGQNVFNQGTFVGRASHAGQSCSRSLYDPLKSAAIRGGVLARQSVAQGSDLRSPLGIEVRLKSKQILAVRME